MKDNFTNGKSEGKIVTVPLLMTKMSLNSKQMDNGCEGHFQKWIRKDRLNRASTLKRRELKVAKLRSKLTLDYSMP